VITSTGTALDINIASGGSTSLIDDAVYDSTGPLVVLDKGVLNMGSDGTNPYPIKSEYYRRTDYTIS